MTALLVDRHKRGRLRHRGGGSLGAKGCFYVCSGFSRTISDKPRNIYSLGVGGGFSVGGDYSIPLNK